MSCNEFSSEDAPLAAQLDEAFAAAERERDVGQPVQVRRSGADPDRLGG